MTQDILLAQPVLEPGFIDLSVGEPVVICENLLKMVNINELTPSLKLSDFSYPSPCGLPDLVKFLEDKHQERVIITNGAKQALGAAFYAVNKLGKKSVGLQNPYWALLPELIKMHGLEISDMNSKDAILAVSPNNPDGSVLDLELLQSKCLENNTILIHDGAYYTDIYLENCSKKIYGDVQIFSISKMFGLSSLRLGYAVCRNDDMYNNMQHYMEHMTVGVGKMQQMLLLNIFKSINLKEFEKKCFDSLYSNKQLISKIDKNIIDINPNFNGMFLWEMVNDWDAFNKAKLYIINGSLFGNKNYVRINMGLKTETIEEVVDRLNLSYKLK